MRRIVSVCVSCVGFIACDGALEGEPASGLAARWSAPSEELLAGRTVPGHGALDSTPAFEPIEVPSDLPDTTAHLMSRYGPTQGAPGARLTILTAFDPSGCAWEGTCHVTIADELVEIVNDQHLLEVVVPRWAQSGPLCVTFQGREECGEVFTVLDAPLVYALTPDHAAVGGDDVRIRLSGDGFTESSVVWLDWTPLVTTVTSAYEITAVVPASALESAGLFALKVHASEYGRCGASSESRDFVVE